MIDEQSQAHFRHFAVLVQKSIEKYGKFPKGKLTEFQRQQFNTLVRLEKEFRDTLLKHRYGPKVYDAFISHICDERRNILAARPFFRERHKIFSERISPALNGRNWKKLKTCRINYQFVAFALRAAPWREGSAVVKIARKLRAARTELVECNLPLAISRARIFFGKAPRSHPSFMDFVQLAAEGLLSGVDKFEPPYREVFRSVAIGWMHGNFIDSNDSTMLHFYPQDRRKLYRARKLLARHPHGGVGVADLVGAVNQDLPQRQCTTEDEISDLLAASTTISSDTRVSGEANAPLNVTKYEAPEETRPDVRAEMREALAVMYVVLEQLSLGDRKILRMYGIKVILEM